MGTDSTFKSRKDAESIVNPVLRDVVTIVKRGGYTTVPGWLKRLSDWLVRMECGSYSENRTPIFKSMSYAEIARMITSLVKRSGPRMSKELGSPAYATSLVAVENHQADKIGPRGHFPPASEWLDKAIDEIWSDKPIKPEMDRQAWKRACDWLGQLYHGPLLDVDDSSIMEGFVKAGTDDADSHTLNVDTNSCFPSYVKGWYHKVWSKAVSLQQRMVQIIIETRARYLWKQLLRQKNYKQVRLTFVATANQRTNVATGYAATRENTYKGKIMSKLRAVCAMPKDDTVLGKPLLNRLIEAAKTLKNNDGSRIFVAYFTPEVIDKSMEIMLETANAHDLPFLSTDYSGFDKTVPPWAAMDVAEALSRWMSPRMAKVFMSLVWTAFYHTSCITTTRIVPEGPSSVKSGSWLTNCIDSFVNLAVQRYGLEAGFYQSIIDQVVNGDDGALCGEGINPESFAAAAAQIGLEANADKQYFAKDQLSFCQKIYFRGLPGGVYPISRTMAALISTEDDVPMIPDDNAEYQYVLTYRTLCRLDVARFNPNFVEFVKLIQQDDKLHLCSDMEAARVAKLAGAYADRYSREALEKPWKSPGQKVTASNSRDSGFGLLPVNRVLRGDYPPPPGKARFKWVYGVDYDSVVV